jgi:hypothetical protein
LFRKQIGTRPRIADGSRSHCDGEEQRHSGNGPAVRRQSRPLVVNSTRFSDILVSDSDPIASLIMVHNVKDLSPDQRLVIEGLLGRALHDEESLTIRPARVLKDAPTGAERTRLFRTYLDHLDALAGRMKDVPEAEIDAAIDDAVQHVRRQAE